LKKRIFIEENNSQNRLEMNNLLKESLYEIAEANLIGTLDENSLSHLKKAVNMT
jgi:hypothetical protein